MDKPGAPAATDARAGARAHAATTQEAAELQEVHAQSQAGGGWGGSWFRLPPGAKRSRAGQIRHLENVLMRLGAQDARPEAGMR